MRMCVCIFACERVNVSTVVCNNVSCSLTPSLDIDFVLFMNINIYYESHNFLLTLIIIK